MSGQARPRRGPPGRRSDGSTAPAARLTRYPTAHDDAVGEVRNHLGTHADLLPTDEHRIAAASPDGAFLMLTSARARLHLRVEGPGVRADDLFGSGPGSFR